MSAQDYERYERAFADVEAPFAFVDADALWSNSDKLLEQAGDKPIRVASKSIRCRGLLDAILKRDDRYIGLLNFTVAEAVFLHTYNFENLLVAYPSVDREAIGNLVVKTQARAEGAPALMVDCVEHLDLIESVIGPKVEPIRVCIDIDAGWWPLKGPMKIGPKRSPLRTPDQVVEFAKEIEGRDRFKLVGLMAYEGQIAGVGDHPPGKPLRGAMIRRIQARSRRELRKRRRKIVEAVSEICDLEFVNGGGTGSLKTTSAEDAVTEVSAGSGFYDPALFDTYGSLSLTPAAFFALPVVRRPAVEVATAAGGGYVASGAADDDRLPRPWLPEGLKLDPQEGAGEVQTPLLGEAADGLSVGDNVYLRHAKAGELCEHFDALFLVQGDEIVDEMPTYRGDGETFL